MGELLAFEPLKRTEKELDDMTEKGKSSTRAKNKYNAANYDNLRIIVPKGKKELIKAHAESQGESINSFVNRAIEETIKKDNK